MYRKCFLCLTLLLGCLFSQTLHAQFDPVNPPEPDQVYSYWLTVDCEPQYSAWNSGNGKYVPGMRVQVNSSPRSDSYHFSHWTLNGERIDEKQLDFILTMPAKALHFVAHYTFNPSNPQEPEMHYFRRLTLMSSPQGIASFNRPAESRVERNTQMNIEVYANQGYKFIGWYDAEGACVSKSPSFFYTMPDQDATLTARFYYSPANPDDPQGGQGGVASSIPGDANYDGVIDMTDAMLILNVYLSGETPDEKILKICDVNGDGVVDVTDVSLVIKTINDNK